MNPHRSATRTQVRLRATAALALSALLSAAACQSQSKRSGADEVDWLVRHGRYEQAVRLASEQAQQRPGDAHAADVWRLASVAWRLDAGRRLSFEDRNEEALIEFEAARQLAPESPQAQAWHAATLDKLAGIWVGRAIAAHAADELDEAVRCYELAMTYRAADRMANEGLARALLQLNYRRGMGEAYYERGIKALGEYWLEQAAHHFSSTLKYDTNERAERRRTQTAILRAENRALIAADLEEAGQFAAARNEYRIATLFDPEHADALAGLARTKVEERASEYLREADRRMMRGDFDAAERALNEGAAITGRQAALFASEADRLTEARLAARYEAVRAIESDHRYEDAIVAYDELLAAAPQGFFRDVIARRDSLTDSVRRAGLLYDEALASNELPRRISLLRQVLLVYPEYKDSRALLSEAESALAAEPTDG